MSLTGEKGGGPVKPGLPVADLTSGLWVAIAILASIAGREKTGKGCYVDFSMLDAQVSLLTLAAARYFALGEVPPRLGTEHQGEGRIAGDGDRFHGIHLDGYGQAHATERLVIGGGFVTLARRWRGGAAGGVGR